MSQIIEPRQKIMAAGQVEAEELHAEFQARGIYVLNLIGSPGAGKTSLLEALAPHLQGQAAVIEGDLHTDLDRQRIADSGLPAWQINTAGACHLDAGMIRKALEQFPLDNVKYLFIENVGNLVCPASFPLGEDAKLTVISVAEGDDKPIKYPKVIQVARGLVITKTDLAPYVCCDVSRMERDARAINPSIEVFATSVNTGVGIEELLAWLQSQARYSSAQA